MELDNVVPIDADTARLLARRRVHFRWFVAFLAAAYVGVLVPTLLFTPLPPIGPFVMLAILVVLAEHRFVLFGDETSMSASIIVVVASVFVFADSSPLAGPLLIGSLGGLYLPHLRRGSLTLTVANASTFGLSAVLAAAISTGTVHEGATGAILGASATVFAYWYTNSVLIGSASAVRQGMLLSESVRLQATSEWQLLILATASALAIHATAPNIASELPVAVIALMAFEIRLRQASRASDFSRVSPWHVATVVGASTAVVFTGSLGAGIALLGLYLVVSTGRLRQSSATASVISIILAIVGTGLTERLGAGPGAAFLVATSVALASAIGVQTLVDSRQVGVHLPAFVYIGLLLPSLSEAAMVSVVAALIAAMSRDLASGPSALVLAVLVLALALATTPGRALAAIRPGFSRLRSSQVASR